MQRLSVAASHQQHLDRIGEEEESENENNINKDNGNENEGAEDADNEDESSNSKRAPRHSKATGKNATKTISYYPLAWRRILISSKIEMRKIFAEVAAWGPQKDFKARARQIIMRKIAEAIDAGVTLDECNHFIFD